MKNFGVKTKAMAVLIAAVLTGGTAVAAARSLVEDSLNDDVNIVAAGSRTGLDGERSLKDAHRESEERDGRDHDDSETGGITLEEAIKIAIGDTPGDLIEVEFERGRYEVKLRTKDGNKKEIYVSAKDGAVVRRK